MNTATVIRELNKRLEAKWQKQDREPREVFSCSSAGQCHRKQILTRAQVCITPMDVDQKRMLMQRTVLHDEVVADLAAVYRDNGYLVSVELELTISNNLSGRADLIAEGPGGELTIVDVKTVHPNITNWTDSLPKEHNVRQVQCYLSGFTGPRRGLLVYVPMGQGQILPYDVEPDDEWVKAEYVELGFEWLEWTIREETQVLPEPLSLVEKTRTRKGEKLVLLEQSWECSYCGFANTVWCHPNYPKNKTGDRKPEEVAA